MLWWDFLLNVHRWLSLSNGRVRKWLVESQLVRWGATSHRFHLSPALKGSWVLIPSWVNSESSLKIPQTGHLEPGTFSADRGCSNYLPCFLPLVNTGRSSSLDSSSKPSSKFWSGFFGGACNAVVIKSICKVLYRSWYHLLFDYHQL